ncbi:Fic family protein [Antribacter gilvus]|uniref:Fic family protein n=1 Tax=Antribacter gilvus TaxID=2304675 RepID=UPI000F7B4D18|nr:Fic family protein [Antribacter gilvus]
MAEEYAIDATQFRETLLEQRASRLPGGLYHLNQVLMAYNSNRIEGSRLSEEQTRYLYETRTVEGVASVDDVVEMTNHFRLFDRMLDAVSTPLTADRIKEYHRILKQATADSDRQWFVVGGWKRLPNMVGDLETTPPDEVDGAVAELLAHYPDPEAMTFEDVCNFHHRFEAIHPFQDGNGRIGRIILFEQCLGAGIMPFIVLDEDKYFYYRGLAEYPNEKGFLRDTFRTYQDRYYARFRDYVRPTS